MAEATFFVSADTFTVILTSCNRHLATIAPRVTFAPITFLVTSTLVVTLALRLAVMERFNCSYCCGLLISDVCDQKPKAYLCGRLSSTVNFTEKNSKN